MSFPFDLVDANRMNFVEARAKPDLELSIPIPDEDFGGCLKSMLYCDQLGSIGS